MPRHVKRFRGGLVSKAHRRVYHPTLGSRVIKKKEKRRILIGPIDATVVERLSLSPSLSFSLALALPLSFCLARALSLWGHEATHADEMRDKEECVLPLRCRAKMAHVRQTRLDRGLQVKVTPLWEGYRESRRCSRASYPESYITKNTRIRI